MTHHFSDNNFRVREIRNSAEKDFFGCKKTGKTENRKRRRGFLLSFRRVLAVFFLIVFFFGGCLLYKTNATFDKMTGQKNSLIKSIITMIPTGGFFQILPVEKEEDSPVERIKNGDLNRLNILLLGLRGVDDPNGGLLTDTVMVASVKIDTGEMALISIPRDLYLDIPEAGHKGKINEAYANGIINSDWKEGLKSSKEAVEDVTGLDIHYVTSVDFEAFKDIINTVGGVKIYLDEPFSEKYQFEEGAIELPQGENIIDGDTALLYVRARFSTNDFDRARRQQQVLIGLKEKALSIGVLSNPVKIISIINALGNHVRTDAELWEIKELAGILYNTDMSNVKRKVFDTSADGLLYQTYSSSGAYILLPEGEDFERIHQACENIFN